MRKKNSTRAIAIVAIVIMVAMVVTSVAFMFVE